MTQHRTSLLRTLLKSLLLPGAVAIIFGVFIVYTLVTEEYDELMDVGLNSKAHLLMTLFESAGDVSDSSVLANALAFERSIYEPEEQSVFWFLDQSDTVIAQSPNADPALLRTDHAEGMITTQGHRIATVRSDLVNGLRVIVAVPMFERNEAIRDVVIGVIVGFILLGLIVAGAVYLAVRRSVGVIADLSTNIAQKNEHDLTPIDRENSFAEIAPAIDKLDALMSRLDTALSAERAFATNAAHELRTPVAICLANVQRLKAKLNDPSAASNTMEIEQGLKRLVRLIERLLQMSRAQSGIGMNATETDIAPIISLLMNELRAHEPSQERLIIHQPTGVWQSKIDPDALGIILNNLFDNALKYASGDTPTVVDARTPGRVIVSNDCDALDLADLDQIKRRFIRKATLSDGYGLGLSIVQELCDQSGSAFEIRSPYPGTQRGFAALVSFPLVDDTQ